MLQCSKKSTYYACINAQCLPIMLNIVLHLLSFCLRIPSLWTENEWLEHYLYSYISQKRLIYFNKTTSRITVLLECNNYAKSHFTSRNLFHYTVILPKMLAWCPMLSGTHYAQNYNYASIIGCMVPTYERIKEKN